MTGCYSGLVHDIVRVAPSGYVFTEPGGRHGRRDPAVAERGRGVSCSSCRPPPSWRALDLFIVNVAFDTIGRDLGASLTDLSWVLNAYAIVYAALLVPLGRLADRYGRKEGFLLGLAVFTLASVACAVSPGLWWLVAARVLQAVGAAALTPTSLALLLRGAEPTRRAHAVRVWAATGALAAALGPVVGGLLVHAAWQWVFLVNVPIGVAAPPWRPVRWVPDSRDPGVERVPDLLGAAVLPSPSVPWRSRWCRAGVGVVRPARRGGVRGGRAGDAALRAGARPGTPRRSCHRPCSG